MIASERTPLDWHIGSSDLMTAWSCNFDKPQYIQLRMSYHYEIGQQVHLLEKNSFGRFLLGADNVITTWPFAFDKSQ